MFLKCFIFIDSAEHCFHIREAYFIIGLNELVYFYWILPAAYLAIQAKIYNH